VTNQLSLATSQVETTPCATSGDGVVVSVDVAFIQHVSHNNLPSGELMKVDDDIDMAANDSSVLNTGSDQTK